MKPDVMIKRSVCGLLEFKLRQVLIILWWFWRLRLYHCCRTLPSCCNTSTRASAPSSPQRKNRTHPRSTFPSSLPSHYGSTSNVHEPAPRHGRPHALLECCVHRSPHLLTTAEAAWTSHLQSRMLPPQVPILAHRLFMITVVLAAKFLDDSFYKNTFYAKVAGFNSTELNQLELKFVLHTDFTLFVSPEDFKCALSTLSAHWQL